MAVNQPNIDSLFHEVLKIEDGDERSRFLDQHCQGDSSLRQEIERLLISHEEAASFLNHPPVFHTVDKPAVQPNGEQHPSVLKAIEKTFGHCPNVELRDALDDIAEPVQQLNSPEIPQRKPGERYQLFGEIARGGMGAIIKGRDIDLGRDLAVKVLLNEHKDRPDVVTRFVEEAQIGGQLQHPGIAPVYELGQFDDDRPFFTMKLVKGKTLAALLSERDNTLSERAKFLGVFEQICQTMGYAHSRCVIHRDLKPANIMVGAFGEVQVMDWGLAKVVNVGGIADERKASETQHAKSIIATLRSSERDTPVGYGSQTQMGSVMGTPAYMAPEQALGEIDQLDSRGDVFGLGAILCEILTGQPPYVASEAMEVFRMARRGSLDECFERLDSCDCDQDLIQLAKQCLAAEKKKRPADAGVLSNRVSRYLESVESRLRETEIERATQEARVQEERKRRRVSLALAASVFSLIVAVVGAGAWVQSQRAAASKELADVERASALEEAAANEKLRQVLYASEVNLACSEIQNGNVDTAREILLGLKPAQGAADLRGLEWNYLMRKCSAPKREKLFEWPEDAPRDWNYDRWSSTSADGNRLAAILNHWKLSDDPVTIVVWNKRTGKEIWRKKLADTDMQIATSMAAIALSSDGKLVAVVCGDFSDEDTGPSLLQVWEVDTGVLVHSVRGFDPSLKGKAVGSRAVKLSPDSNSILLVTAMHPAEGKPLSRLVAWDLGKKEPRFQQEGSFTSLGLAISPDSSKVALINGAIGSSAFQLTDESQIIQILDASNGQLQKELHLEPFHMAFFCCFSPNSQHLAVPASNRSPNNYEFKRSDSLTIWDTQTGNRVVSASTRSENCDLRYSPNGEVVALHSYGNGTIELFSATDGVQLARLTGYHGGAIEFSSDSKSLSVLDREGVRSTWEIPGNNFDARDYSATGSYCMSGNGTRFARINMFDALKSGEISKFIYDQKGEVFSHSWRFPGELVPGRIFTTGNNATKSLSKLALNHDGSALVSVERGSEDGGAKWAIQVWDVEQRRVRGSLCDLQESQTLLQLKAAPTGSHVAGIIGSNTGEKSYELKLKVWDIATREEVSSMQFSDKPFPSNLEFSRDGSRIAVVFGLRTIRDGEANPDPKQIEKSMVKLYRVADGQHLLDLPTPVHRRASVTFNGGGSLLAAPNVISSRIDVWDLETGSKQIELEGAKPQSSLVFAPTGDRLVAHAVGFQGQLNVWDINSGNRLLNEVTYNFASMSDHEINFLPDKHRLIRWGANGPPLILDGRPLD